MKNKKSGKKRWSNMGKALHMELREHKSSFLVYVVLRLLVIIVMALQLINGNYENVFLCLLTLLLLIIPGLLQVNLRIELPTPLEIIILLFIFSAEILGEISQYYIIYPYWDAMLHTLNGFLAAAIGFSLVDILNRDEKFVFQLSPAFMAIVAFCFSMTIGVLWEFFEFGMDMFFKLDMQKDTVLNMITTVMLDPNGGNHPVQLKGITEVLINGQNLGLGGYLDIGLIDTMKDLIVNFIGAVVFSVIGFFYVKKRGRGKFAKEFIPTLKKEEADFLAIVEEEEEKEETDTSQIKTVIFDLGNVLVDFNFEEFFRERLKDEETVNKVINATVSSPLWPEFDRGVMTFDDILKGFIENDRSVERELRSVFKNLNGMIRMRDYTMDWITSLKEQGYQVLYLSNFPEKTYLDCREEMQFLDSMDGGILSYREREIKPEPAIYEILIRRYGLIPENCVFLDDNHSNVKAACQQGIHGILFDDREEAVKELEKLGIRL